MKLLRKTSIIGGLRSLSIVIPAFNEEKRLPATLDTILQYTASLKLEALEVLVVDDGSRDGTARVVTEYQRDHEGVRLLQNPGNRGKGYAVRHGMSQAALDWVLFSDADLSAPIEELATLSKAAEAAGADGAIGSRAIDRSLIGIRQSWFREFSGRVFNAVMRLITGLPFVDTQCGFKLFRRDAARVASQLQRLEGFGFDVELLFILRKHGFRILEVPVRWNNAEGTKVSLWNGLAAFLDPLKVRWQDLQGLYSKENLR